MTKYLDLPYSSSKVLVTMEDGEQDVPHNALDSGPHVLVATTLATVLLAGSALIWRSNFRNLLPYSEKSPSSGDVLGVAESTLSGNAEASEEKRDLDGPSSSKRRLSQSSSKTVVEDGLSLAAQDAANNAKNSRSKERRRRGKDPLKEILKGGKRGKGLGKLTRVNETPENFSGTGGTAPQADLPAASDSASTHRPRGTSVSTSSRSVSSASSSRLNDLLNVGGTTSESYENSKSSEDSDDEDLRYPSTPTAVSLSRLDDESLDVALYDSQASNSATPQTKKRDDPMISPAPIAPSYSSTSHSSVPSTSTSAFAGSMSTRSTSPSLTSFEDPSGASSHATSSHSPLSHTSQNGHLGSPIPLSDVVSNLADQREWNSNGIVASVSEPLHQKPPRFRPNSRDPVSPISLPPPNSISMPAVISHSSSDSTPMPSTSSAFSQTSPSATSSPFSDAKEGHDGAAPLVFPSLNNPASPGPDPGPLRSNLNGNVSGNNNTPRRVTTPRRTPTPSSGGGTPPPSLSQQTQIASLKGALEAARMREEKTRSDIERYAKEMEVLRWESSVWRRREAEVSLSVSSASIPQTHSHLRIAATSPDPAPRTPTASLRDVIHVDAVSTRPTRLSSSSPQLQ